MKIKMNIATATIGDPPIGEVVPALKNAIEATKKLREGINAIQP